MPEVFVQLAILLAVALVVTVIVEQLRQPLVVGYIVTGIIVGPAVLNIVQSRDAIDAFGKIGVALLLFIVGLGLKPKMIREVGRVAVLTGLGQILLTTVLGYPLARLLGYSPIVSLYLSIAFTFSSTIIILQLLYAKEEQDTLYGRIATGFLLVQDFVAMLIFLFLTSAREGSGAFSDIAWIIMVKVVTVTIVGYLIAHELVPRIDTYFARHHQIIFLFALSACFGLAALFAALDFTLELGALVAGVLLAASPYHREIATRLGGLMDFFLLMFFVVLGTQVSSSSLAGTLPAIIVFSGFILIGNPLIVILLMRRFGYTLETSFLASLTVSQITA